MDATDRDRAYAEQRAKWWQKVGDGLDSTDRAYAELAKEAAEAEEEKERWRRASKRCQHDYTLLRAGIRRENPDDGTTYVDVFYCKRCLTQHVLPAVVS